MDVAHALKCNKIHIPVRKCPTETTLRMKSIKVGIMIYIKPLDFELKSKIIPAFLIWTGLMYA